MRRLRGNDGAARHASSRSTESSATYVYSCLVVPDDRAGALRSTVVPCRRDVRTQSRAQGSPRFGGGPGGWQRTSADAMRLPGVCISCREPVIWTGKRWRVPGRGTGRTHVCGLTGGRWSVGRCGRLMPVARERCGRQPLHRDYCRSPYAMENARLARMG